MKTMQIFIGGRNSGKTQLAKKITADKKTLWLPRQNGKYAVNDHFLFDRLTDDTEYIVFEDAYNIGEIAKMLYNDQIIVNIRCKRSFVVARPKVIIIKDSNCAAQLPSSLSFHARFDILDLDDIKTIQSDTIATNAIIEIVKPA
jgi:hypothetical protein